MAVVSGVGDRELSARERRMVHMTSNIFGEGLDKSVYSAKVQKELLKSLKETFNYVKEAPIPETLNLPSAAEQKKKLMAGNQAVLPGSTTNGPTAVKRDPDGMMCEMSAAVTRIIKQSEVVWVPRKNIFGRCPPSCSKRRSQAWEWLLRFFVFHGSGRQDRLMTASAPRSDLIGQTDYLTLDSALHERHSSTRTPENERAFASKRVQANLASSGKNTLPQPDIDVQAPPPQSDSLRTSGADMRNFSELFGTELGRRTQPITERQEGCSAIESARKDPGRIAQADSPRNRKEAEMSSTMGQMPKPTKAPELQQALDVERGFWDSKDGFGISAEVSRRRREKDFRKDFEGDVHHLSRKQECLDSAQVKGNMGQDSAREVPKSARNGLRLSSPHSPCKHSGVSAAQREDLLRRAKDR
eukprot:g33112.t1